MKLQHDGIQPNTIQFNNIQHNDVQHNNIRHKDIQKDVHKWQLRIFVACFIAYTAAYICRVNISVALPRIQKTLNLSSTKVGLIGTSFFWVYAIGQLVNGYIGDKISSRRFIFVGLFVSALLNILFGFSKTLLLMILLWGTNGIFQSMLWGPIVKTLSNWFPEKRNNRIASGISFSMIIGYLIAWGFAGIIVNRFGWNWAFWFPAVLVLFLAGIWFVMARDKPEDVGLHNIHNINDTYKYNIESISGKKKINTDNTGINNNNTDIDTYINTNAHTGTDTNNNANNVNAYTDIDTYTSTHTGTSTNIGTDAHTGIGVCTHINTKYVADSIFSNCHDDSSNSELNSDFDDDLNIDVSSELNVKDQYKKLSFLKLISGTNLLYVAITGVMQGIVRDSISFWGPKLVMDTQHLSTTSAIGTILIIPVLNLIGIMVGGWLNKLLKFKERISIALLMFGSSLVTLCLVFFKNMGSVFSVLLIACASAFMFAAGPSMTTIIPLRYKKYGRVSSVAGFIDFSIYVGSGLAATFIGLMVDFSSWNNVFIIWSLTSFIGALTMLVSMLKKSELVL